MERIAISGLSVHVSEARWDCWFGQEIQRKMDIGASRGRLRGLPIAGRRGEYLLYGPLEVDSGKTTQGRTCAGKLP